jgi:predicted amidophosphoribosyltransferase
VTEQSADIRDADTDWNRACPHCGAKIQAVARACWQCGAPINESDSEHADYRPPRVDPEEVAGMSISVLLAISVFFPMMLALWILSYFW